MTDKRIKSYLEDRLKRLDSIMDEREWTTSELGDIACCKQTLAFIDSLQEESVSIWHDATEEAPTPGSNILMVRKEEKDTNYPPIAGCFHGTNSRLDGRNWGYYNGFCYNEIEPPVKWAYIDDILNLSIIERTVKNWKEPVSDDLGEYINELSKQFPEVSFAKLSRIAVRVSRWQQNQDVKNKLPKVTNRTDLDEYAYQCAYDMSNDWAIENPTWKDVEDACKLGANWQKQQDQSTIELAEDHAMLAGMEKMKEQMMAKAIDGYVIEDIEEGNGDFLLSAEYLPKSMELKDRQKVKVVVVKED